MDIVPRSLAWAGGAVAFGVADLYAVGGAFGRADLLLMAFGALPVAAFAVLALRSRDPHDNQATTGRA